MKFKNRYEYIGASDFPVIMEKSKWKKKIQLVLEKAQVLAQEEKTGTALDRGNRLEPIVIAEFEKQTGLKVCNFQKEVIREKTDNCIKLLAHLDGEIENTNIPMEAKTTNIKNKWEDIPEYYIPQLEFQMFLNKADRAYIAVGYVENDADVDICGFDYFEYIKSMTDEEIIQICKQFTADVNKFKELGVVNNGQVINSTYTKDELVERYEVVNQELAKLKEQAKIWESEKKEIEAIFKNDIQENWGIDTGKYQILLGNRITSPTSDFKVSRCSYKVIAK